MTGAGTTESCCVGNSEEDVKILGSPMELGRPRELGEVRVSQAGVHIEAWAGVEGLDIAVGGLDIGVVFGVQLAQVGV